jgi:hypothetical protein
MMGVFSAVPAAPAEAAFWAPFCHPVVPQVNLAKQRLEHEAIHLEYWIFGLRESLYRAACSLRAGLPDYIGCGVERTTAG